MLEDQLSLEKCRQLLPADFSEMPDEKLEVIRQMGFEIAETVVNMYESCRAGNPSDLDSIRSSGTDGFLKLMGYDLADLAELSEELGLFRNSNGEAE